MGLSCTVVQRSASLKMKIFFTKLQGLGNDYLFLDNLSGRYDALNFPHLSIKISNRHFGVGPLFFLGILLHSNCLQAVTV